jgi:hypothetical protein
MHGSFLHRMRLTAAARMSLGEALLGLGVSFVIPLMRMATRGGVRTSPWVLQGERSEDTHLSSLLPSA